MLSEFLLHQSNVAVIKCFNLNPKTDTDVLEDKFINQHMNILNIIIKLLFLVHLDLYQQYAKAL